MKLMKVLKRLLPIFVLVAVMYGMNTVVFAQDETPSGEVPVAEQPVENTVSEETSVQEGVVDNTEDTTEAEVVESAPAQETAPAQESAPKQTATVKKASSQEPTLTVQAGTRTINSLVRVTADTTWDEEEISIYGNGRVEISNNATLTIKSGTVMVTSDPNYNLFTVKAGSTLKLIEQTVFDLSNLYGKSAIWVEANGTLIMDKSTLQDATALNSSAVILSGTTDSPAIADINDSIFVNNNGTDGSVFRGSGAKITIDNSLFQDNSAWANTVFPRYKMENGGGAIHIRNDSQLWLNGTTFLRNHTTNDHKVDPEQLSYGGAVFVHGSAVYINGSKFIDNYTGTSGGAVFVSQGSNAWINDWNGEPTEFIGNYVTDSANFAGGALFVNLSHVYMNDVAIFGNSAEHAGGGIASCTTGTSQVHSLEGAAIFDNSVTGEGYPDPDNTTYSDVYIQTTDHVNTETGELIPAKQGAEGYEYYTAQMYERMFNGGLHKWQGKYFLTSVGEGKTVNSFSSVSDPTNRDTSKAKVIFTENYALAGVKEGSHAFGGAIGNNGLVVIGSTLTDEIKVVKVWNDNNNNDGLRPTAEEFLNKIHILDPQGNEVDKADLVIDVIEQNINDYILHGNVVELHEQPQYGDNAWLIVISGLSHLLEGEYTIVEDGVPSYQMISNTGTMYTYFELTNEHIDELIDIAVRKVWTDYNNLYGVRPNEVVIRLLADGVEVGTLTLSEATNWQGSFTSLPKYANGIEIVYMIQEDSVELYTTIITGSAAEGFVVENKTTLPEIPDEPDEPKKKEEPKKETVKKVAGVQTGMETFSAMYAMMTGLSFAGAIVLKKKH